MTFSALHLPTSRALRPGEPRTARRLATAALLGGAVAAVAGCGASTPASDVLLSKPTTAHFLSQARLEQGLAGGVRDGLGRLAVMQQPTDGAADLGQDLPEGLVEGVTCSATASRPAAVVDWPWRCDVRWRTARGSRQLLRYAVVAKPNGCFAARAEPQMADVHDATIQTYSEHPLNAIFSLGRGC